MIKLARAVHNYHRTGAVDKRFIIAVSVSSSPTVTPSYPDTSKYVNYMKSNLVEIERWQIR